LTQFFQFGVQKSVLFFQFFDPGFIRGLLPNEPTPGTMFPSVMSLPVKVFRHYAAIAKKPLGFLSLGVITFESVSKSPM